MEITGHGYGDEARLVQGESVKVTVTKLVSATG